MAGIIQVEILSVLLLLIGIISSCLTGGFGEVSLSISYKNFVNCQCCSKSKMSSLEVLFLRERQKSAREDKRDCEERRGCEIETNNISVSHFFPHFVVT